MYLVSDKILLAVKKNFRWFKLHYHLAFMIMLCGCSDIAIMDITSGSIHTIPPPEYNQFRQFLLGVDFENQFLYGILPLDNDYPEREYLITSYNLNGEMQTQKKTIGNIPLIDHMRYFLTQLQALVFIEFTPGRQKINILNLQTLQSETVFDNSEYPGFIFYSIYPVDQGSFLIHASNASSDQRIIYYNFRKRKVISELSSSCPIDLLAISDKSQNIITAEKLGKKLLRYDLSTGQLIQKISLPPNMRSSYLQVPRNAFSPDDNSFVASLCDNNQNAIYLINYKDNPVSFRKIFSINKTTDNNFIFPFGFYNASTVFLIIKENGVYSLLLYNISNDNIEKRITLPTSVSDCFIVQNGVCIFYD